MDYERMLDTIQLLLKVAAVSEETATVTITTQNRTFEVSPDGSFIEQQ